jgi:hypothetical protein
MQDIGDSEFLPEEVLDEFNFRLENATVEEAGGRPAQGKAVLLGITKASLSIVEEPIPEPTLDVLTGYEGEARLTCKSGLNQTGRLQSLPIPCCPPLPRPARCMIENIAVQKCFPSFASRFSQSSSFY